MVQSCTTSPTCHVDAVNGWVVQQLLRLLDGVAWHAHIVAALSQWLHDTLSKWLPLLHDRVRLVGHHLIADVQAVQGVQNAQETLSTHAFTFMC